jgi:hypothetical protein
MKKQSVQKRANWAGAFTSFCQGVPVDEIATMFDIELATLQSKIYQEHWAQLRATLPLGDTLKRDTEMTAPGQIKMLAMQANREKNLEAWVKLRDHAVEFIDRLRAGTLKMEKSWNNKGFVVTHETEPTTGDLVNIATYLRTISDGTYRALGDFQAQEKPGQDGPAGTAAQAPAITIILPNVIAAPRDQRGGADTIIDLSHVKPAEDSAAELKSANPDEAAAPEAP